MTALEEFTAACIEALYCTDTGDDEQPPSDADLSEETRLDLEADCRSFWHRFGCYVVAAGMSEEQAGHDFWLTRNGHGTGFWDRGLPDPYGELLTNAAKDYGEFYVYLGDDGLIHS